MLQPKFDEDRFKQEQYTQEAFQQEAKDIVSELDAVSVSTHLALKALKENDSVIFEESGYPRFMKKLGEICGKDAVELKMTAPKSRINSMVDEIIKGGILSGHSIAGVQEYRQEMEKLHDAIAKTKTDLTKSAMNAIPQISSEAINKIISRVHDASREAMSGKTITLDSEVNQIITKTTAHILQKKFAEILKEKTVSCTDKSNFKAISGIQVAPTMESVERTVYTAKTVRRDPRGLIEYIDHFIFKTEFKETKITSKQVKEYFISGDNSSQVGDKIIKQVTEQIKGYVQAVINEMQQDYFGEAEMLIDAVIQKLQVLESNIRKERLL